MIRIFLVDDYPIVRRGYIALIKEEPDLEVCGEAATALEALEKISPADPDLALIDISLMGTSGIELVKQLAQLKPDLLTIVVSMHDESVYAERALQAGARGYVMKKEADTTVITAIRRVLHGGLYLSNQMSRKILRQHSRHQEPQSPLIQLSDRELEAFDLMGHGLTTQEIADLIHISPKTVESHRSRIKKKLDISTTEELLLQAVLWVATGRDPMGDQCA